MPDDELLKAAATGRLAMRADVVREAERMIADRRARTKMRGFFLQWLKVDQAPDIAKDPKQYPQYRPGIR